MKTFDILDLSTGQVPDPEYGIGCYRVMRHSDGTYVACFEARSMLGNRLTGGISANSAADLDAAIHAYPRAVREEYMRERTLSVVYWPDDFPA